MIYTIDNDEIPKRVYYQVAAARRAAKQVIELADKNSDVELYHECEALACMIGMIANHMQSIGSRAPGEEGEEGADRNWRDYYTHVLACGFELGLDPAQPAH